MATFELFGRPGCHLCDLMLEELLPLTRGRADVDVHDVDTRLQWHEKYDIRVPVLEYKGRVVAEIRLDHAVIAEILAEIGILRRC